MLRLEAEGGMRWEDASGIVDVELLRISRRRAEGGQPWTEGNSILLCTGSVRAEPSGIETVCVSHEPLQKVERSFIFVYIHVRCELDEIMNNRWETRTIFVECFRDERSDLMSCGAVQR